VSQRAAASELRGDALLGSAIVDKVEDCNLTVRNLPPRRDCNDKRIVCTLYTADHLSYNT
jgi:hypothetical protein